MQQALFSPIIHTRYYSHQIEGAMHGFVPHMNKRFEDIIKNRDRQDVASIVVCNNQFGNNGHIRHINFT